ncbi:MULTISPECIES: RidA family protein [Acinetobacter]|uniref:RidA family protein n=1 Tax=Acinetobacter TaxID=469 RepID=UPI000E34FA3B|nr:MULTISPECIES: Rid family hydrolase [Acinetobacter]RFS31709.1 RidA family protein [Acinetobacter sp. SWAC5]RKG45571.1 RidA family protein [Acinetobacter cumulans]RKG49420.1 RidA family protein [Acinetobacter cumulans]RZG60576.1 RidA family protein [Acinetobacter sp. WCHAc060006]
MQQNLHSVIHLMNPDTLYNPTPFAYSHIAQVNIHELNRIVHIAGQGGEQRDQTLATDFTIQLAQAMHNVQLALEAAKATLYDIAMLRIWVCQYDQLKHQLIIQHLKALWQAHALPACTLIPVPCLALPDMQIEIEATAYCA